MIETLTTHCSFFHVAKAMVALKKPRPDRQPMLSFVVSATEAQVNDKAVTGLFKWMASPRLNYRKVQLPAAMKGLDMVVRICP